MKLGGKGGEGYAYNTAPMTMLSIALSELVWLSDYKIFEAISIMSMLWLN